MLGPEDILPEPLDIIQFPGEPDIVAEKRLRFELRMLRDWATRTGSLDFFTDIVIQQVPEKASSILKQMPFVFEAKRILGKRLLNMEVHFVEKGWRLPRWRRPQWLLDSER